MRRYELTDTQFALLEPFLPQPGNVGHPWSAHRPILNGIFWKLRTGAPWRDVPERYGPWQTLYDRFVFWRRDGTWQHILNALQIQLDANGQLDWEQFNIDGSSVRATRAAAGARHDGRDQDEPSDHALGRAVGGFSTKLHLVSDGRGLPLNATLTKGQAHESTQFEAVVEPIAIHRKATNRVRRYPRRLAGDRAYHAKRIRMWLHRRGIQVVIPPRRSKAKKPKRGRPYSYNAEQYRGRNVVERCVGWLKEYRSIATRYDKLAVNYLMMVKLGFLMRYLRLLA